jgi:hypothetical protein
MHGAVCLLFDGTVTRVCAGYLCMACLHETVRCRFHRMILLACAELRVTLPEPRAVVDSAISEKYVRPGSEGRHQMLVEGIDIYAVYQ